MIIALTLVMLGSIHCIYGGYDHAYIMNRCLNPHGVEGSCMFINNCDALKPLLKRAETDQNAVNFLRRSICGTAFAHVCCPRSTQYTTKIERLVKTEKMVSEICGKTEVAENKRVLGGSPCELGAWPWIAALGYKNPMTSEIKWKCAGSLISIRYVLTAAHCLQSVYIYRVRLGEHNIKSDFDGANPVDYGIEKKIIHEFYVKPAKDIGLIRLDKDVEFTDKIRPICLPTDSLRSSNYERKEPFVIGWGDTSISTNNSASDVLLQVQVPIVNNEKCGFQYKGKASITSDLVCAGKGGKDSCQGDSGGPLMLPEKGIFYLIGVVSHGYKCGLAEYPGVYTRVSSYINWIKNHME